MPEKQIHIRLSEKAHRGLRVKCAYEGVTVQDYVRNLIGEQLELYGPPGLEEPKLAPSPAPVAPRQGAEGLDDLPARAELEAKYAARIVERPELRWLASYVPNKTIPFQRWFRYKEAFSHEFPQLALSRFGLKKGATILDPFCGVGTVLLAAREIGYRARGFDLLPLAVFASRVKLRMPEEYDLDRLKARATELCSARLGKSQATLPDITILPKAFDPETAEELVFLRDAILQEPDVPIREFLLLGLLAVVEDVSHTCKDGLGIKLQRKAKLPRVQEALGQQLRMMLADLTGAVGLSRNGGSASVDLADVRSLPLKPGSVAGIITSPPYLNRYDYARIYSIELALGFLSSFAELRELRHRLLRGHIEAKPASTDRVNRGLVPVVLERLKAVPLNNPNIPTMIKAYFEDMYDTIAEMGRVCRRGGHVAMLTGNSRFGGEVIPVDLVLSDIAETQGFATREIWVLHYKGNASQQMGRYGQQRVRESVVFWQKQ